MIFNTASGVSHTLVHCNKMYVVNTVPTMSCYQMVMKSKSDR